MKCKTRIEHAIAWFMMALLALFFLSSPRPSVGMAGAQHLEMSLEKDPVKLAGPFEIGTDPVPEADKDFSKMIQPWWDMFPYETLVQLQDLYAQLEKAVQEEEQKEAQRKLRLEQEAQELRENAWNIVYTTLAVMLVVFFLLWGLQFRNRKRI